MKINILPQDVYSLIAAGEIIERPASIVRELIQNSIDANADSITLEVNEGGKSLIRVVDTGEGMSYEDLKICILPHSTSKIKHSDDLKHITTYGFRGEALHAISRVSILSIESRDKLFEYGHGIVVKNGKIVEEYETPLNQGTIISVKDIFYNLPARKKFLKTQYTEFSYCNKEFVNYAIVNENINFKLIHNGKIIYNLKISDRDDRIRDVFGKDFVDNTYKLDFFQNDIRITGYIAKPNLFDNTKYRFNHIFVNNRYVSSPIIRRAVYSGFEGQLANRYCPFIIFIELAPELIDINIHPAKKEIKFTNEKELFPAIVSSIKSAININKYMEKKDIGFNSNDVNSSYSKSDFNSAEEQKLFSDFDFEISEKVREIHSNEQSFFWQYAKSYIITELKGHLYVIDQHAAHERIMYEKFKNQKDNLTPQKLLFSHTIELPIELMEVYEKTQNIINKAGFITRKFGKNIILLEGIPAIIERNFDNNDFLELLEDFDKLNEIKSVDNIIKTLACKSAIKANTKLNEMEMAKIFSELFNCDNPYACPHGRPTIMKFEKAEVEKWFKRT